jgi:hypothetical protein
MHLYIFMSKFTITIIQFIYILHYEEHFFKKNIKHVLVTKLKIIQMKLYKLIRVESSLYEPNLNLYEPKFFVQALLI